MLNRKEILERAYHDCMAEMYAKAQPPGDYDRYLEDARTGKIGKDECVYERHYLSKEEFEYIRDKYIDAYGIKEHWCPDIEVLEDYLNNGGTKDKYIPERVDEDGFRHPGYRGYENVKPIKEQIREIVINELGEGNVSEKIIDTINNTVMNTISDCKNFYRFDRERSEFSCSVALGASPTFNPNEAIEYWKSQGVDVDIEIRNPLLFWDQEYYGDEFEEVMEDEYGENWKEIKHNEWQENVRKEKEEREKRMKELMNQIKDKENE